MKIIKKKIKDRFLERRRKKFENGEREGGLRVIDGCFVFKCGFKTNDEFAFNSGCKDAIGKRKLGVLRVLILIKILKAQITQNLKIKGYVGSKYRDIVKNDSRD